MELSLLKFGRFNTKVCLIMKNEDIFVSIAMPCFNEQKSLGIYIEKVQNTGKSLGLLREVVVSDNGPTDNSVAIARRLDARIVHQPQQGYGAAYLAEFVAARGEYLIMGDSDDTYDFTDLERFITPLQEGYNMVIGNRFKGKNA